MANRVPLIANSSANQIQELPVLDNLDLSQSGIVNAVSIGVTNVHATGIVTATTLVKSGGSSSQFLKADGSVDSSAYLTSFTETDPVVGAINGIVKANGSGTISTATAGTDYLTPTGDGSGLTSLSAANLSGTAAAINGSNITDLNGSNIASGTVAAARIPTLNQNTTGTAGGLSGTPTISVTDVQVGGALTVTGDLTVNGTQTILNTTSLEVEDINIGIASASSKLNNSELDGAGITIYGSQGDKTLTWDNGNSRLAFSTDVYAPKYYGDGSNLQGVVSGVTIQEEGSSLSTQATTLNFVGDNVTASGSGATKTITIGGGLTIQEEGSSLSTQATTINFVGDNVTASGSGATKTITISGGGGIQTTASSPAANTVVTLNLGTAQHHDITLAAGITTITCTGGSFGESHSLVITQPSSGTATVEFSEYFLFPSGATPVMSAGGGKIDLISFVVKREGATGITTQLLASAGLNYQ